MAKIKLSNGKTIVAPDGLSKSQYDEIVEDAYSKLGITAQQTTPTEQPLDLRDLAAPDKTSLPPVTPEQGTIPFSEGALATVYRGGQKAIGEVLDTVTPKWMPGHTRDWVDYYKSLPETEFQKRNKGIGSLLNETGKSLPDIATIVASGGLTTLPMIEGMIAKGLSPVAAKLIASVLNTGIGTTAAELAKGKSAKEQLKTAMSFMEMQMFGDSVVPAGKLLRDLFKKTEVTPTPVSISDLLRPGVREYVPEQPSQFYSDVGPESFGRKKITSSPEIVKTEVVTNIPYSATVDDTLNGLPARQVTGSGPVLTSGVELPPYSSGPTGRKIVDIIEKPQAYSSVNVFDEVAKPSSINGPQMKRIFVSNKYKVNDLGYPESFGAKPEDFTPVVEVPHKDLIKTGLPAPAKIVTDLSNHESGYAATTISPDRVINKITGTVNSPLHMSVVDPFKEAHTNIYDRNLNIKAKMGELIQKTGIKLNSKEDIILRKIGENIATPKEAATIPSKAKDVLKEIRTLYEDALEELNIARATRGQDPIPKRDDYFTHVSEMNFIDRTLGDLVDTPAEEISSYAVGKTPYTPFAIHRIGTKTVTAGKIGDLKKAGGIKASLASLFEKFATTEPPGAISGLNLYLKKVADITERIHAANRIEFAIKDLPPNAKKYFDGWVRRAVLKKQYQGEKNLDKLSKPFEAIQHGISSSFITGSARTALAQFSSVAQTINELGLINTFKGLKNVFSEEISNIPIVKTRVSIPEIATDSFIRPSLKKLNDILNIPLTALDNLQVRIAASAAREAGIKRGLVGKELVSFIDRLTSMTQAESRQGLKAGFQENRFGKLAAPLQTFTVNLYNTLVRDSKALSGGSKIKQIRYILAGIGSMYGINEVYNKVGLPAPFQTTDFIPLVGGYLKYGRIHPVIEQIRQLGLIATDSWEGDKARATAWQIPFRFVPGGAQAIRTIEGAKAISEGGVKTKNGKLKWNINTMDEQLRALLLGPKATIKAKEYYESKP